MKDFSKSTDHREKALESHSWITLQSSLGAAGWAPPGFQGSTGKLPVVPVAPPELVVPPLPHGSAGAALAPPGCIEDGCGMDGCGMDGCGAS